VQYNRIDDANKLIQQSQIPLILKGNQLSKRIHLKKGLININSINLDVLPAREVRSRSTKSSSTDRSSKRQSHERNSHRQTTNYESSRKRFPTCERSNFNPQM
jgi:hypothetical protein